MGLAETLTVGLVETLTVGELLVETDVVGGVVVEELLAVAETVMDVVAVLLARVLPERVVERLVLGIVDRLVAVPAGGCGCCLLQRLVAVLRGSQCDSVSDSGYPRSVHVFLRGKNRDWGRGYAYG